MTDQELALKRSCEDIIERCAGALLAAGAPPEMVADRMISYAAGLCVQNFGSSSAARALAHAAQRVEIGAYARLDPTAPRNRN